MPIQAPHFQRSVLLSSYQVQPPIKPLDVIRVLNQGKISFVLVGAYGLADWRKEARATEDVDVVVASRQIKKATKLLLEAFPHLVAVDLPVVVRLKDPSSGFIAIDVMKPNELYRETFKHTHTVQVGRRVYRIPSLEMAVTMKFASMCSPNRLEEDKLQDAHDFILMVKNNTEIDLAKLAQLGNCAYGEGGKDVLELVRKVRAGEKLIL